MGKLISITEDKKTIPSTVTGNVVAVGSGGGKLMQLAKQQTAAAPSVAAPSAVEQAQNARYAAEQSAAKYTQATQRTQQPKTQSNGYVSMADLNRATNGSGVKTQEAKESALRDWYAARTSGTPQQGTHYSFATVPKPVVSAAGPQAKPLDLEEEGFGYMTRPQPVQYEAEDKTLAQRLRDAIGYGAKSTGASYTNNAGNAIFGEAARRRQETSGEIKAWQDTIDAYRDVLNDPESTEAERGTARTVIAELERRIGAYESAYGTGGANERAAGKVWSAADKLADSAAKDMERAKKGATGAESLLVDLAATGTQMLGDRILSPIPGAGLIPMAARVLGSSSQEARRGGADFAHAMAYGGASALTEVLTEQMFDGLAGVYGKGAADDVVKDVISRLSTNGTVRNALNVLASAAGESAEELASGLAAPALQTIWNGKSLGRNYSEQEMSDILYDMLVGGIMGGLGGAVETAQNQASYAKEGRTLRAADAVQSVIDEGLASHGDTDSYRLARSLQQRLNNGGRISDADVGRAYQANVEAIEAENEALKDIQGYSFPWQTAQEAQDAPALRLPVGAAGSAFLDSYAATPGGTGTNAEDLTSGMNRGAEGQKNAPDGATVENTRLTADDLDAYLNTGRKLHTRTAKGRLAEELAKTGQSPILTTPEEISAFIRDSIDGKIENEIRGYGKVGQSLADAIRIADTKINADKINGNPLNVAGSYLELESNHLMHLDDHILDDEDVRNIPLTKEEAEHIPDFIDNATDIINVIRRKDGNVRIQIGTKVNGYSVVTECVSKERSSLHPVTAWKMSTDDYESRYKNRRTTAVNTSRAPDGAQQVDISRNRSSKPIIAEPQSKVNAENSTDSESQPANAVNPSDAEKNALTAERAAALRAQRDAEADPMRRQWLEAAYTLHEDFLQSLEPGDVLLDGDGVDFARVAAKDAQGLTLEGTEASDFPQTETILFPTRAADGRILPGTFLDGEPGQRRWGSSVLDYLEPGSQHGVPGGVTVRHVAETGSELGGQMDLFAAMDELGLHPNAPIEAEADSLPAYGTRNAARQAQFRRAERIAKIFGAALEVDTPEGGGSGRYQNGTITIDPNTENPVLSVLVHELTHHMENSGRYGAFADMVVKYVSNEMGVDVDAMKQAIRQEYARGGITLDDDGAQRELVAKFAESKLFTDEKAIERLARENRTLFDAIRDWIGDVVVKLTGTEEEKFLRRAERMYEKALRSVGEVRETNGQQLYAGEGARTADFNRLAEAQRMEKQGADNETIRRETGWFKGMDGRWRFEIDDSGMRYFRGGDAQFRADHPEYAEYQDLMQKALTGTLSGEEEARLRSLGETWGREYGRLSERVDSGNATLANLIQHDALFAAYPELKDARVRFEDLGGEKGGYNPVNNTITLDKSLRSAPEDTVIHELQHAIQQAEGFSPGASPEYWANKKESQNRYYERVREKKDTILRSLSGKDAADYARYEELRNEWLRLIANDQEDSAAYARCEAEMDALQEKLSQTDWYRELRELEQRIGNPVEAENALYRNTAGEIEARDAAGRRTMDAEARYLTAPDLGDGDTVFAEEGGKNDLIGRTTENKPFVEVTDDILAGVPQSDWVKTVKDNLKSKFPNGITVGNNQIIIDSDSRRELTYSRYMQWLYSHDPLVRADKMRATNNADEILQATTDWINEGLNHPRRDSIRDFARGSVLLRVGGNDYIADVVVGTKANGQMKLYDVLHLQPTAFTAKEMGTAKTAYSSPSTSRNTATISALYDTTSGQNVNREYDGARYLPTAEDIEAGGTYRTDGEGRQSYGRSFDELVDEVRPLPAAEDIENGYVPGSAAEYAQTTRGAADDLAPAQADLDEYWKSVESMANPVENRTDPQTLVSAKSEKKQLPLSKKAEEAWSYFKRKMLDSGEAVTRVGKAVGDDHLYHYYNMARASTNAATSMLTDAAADVRGRRTGKSLSDVFDPIRAKGADYYNAFQLYLLHLHNVDRMSRFDQSRVDKATAAWETVRSEFPELLRFADYQIEQFAQDENSPYYFEASEYVEARNAMRRAEAVQNKPVFGWDVTADKSRTAADELARQHPEFEELAEDVYGYIDNLLRYRVDSGLITEDDYNHLKEIYPHYVPTYRTYDRKTDTRNRGRVQVGSTIGTATGSSEKLMPLHEALAKQTMNVVREGSKNRFGLRLLNSRAEKNPQASEHVQSIEPYQRTFDPENFDDIQNANEALQKDNTFVVRADGKQYEITVSPAMFEAVRALSPEGAEQNTFTKIVRKGNDLFKRLVTGWNPTFLLRNFARDLQDAGLYSKDLSEFAKQFPQAYAEIANDGDYWQMYKALGGTYSSIFDYETGNVEEGNALQQKTIGRIEALNEAVEQAPRLAEFMATVKKNGGLDADMDTLMEAMYNAADVTVNFGRSGTLGKKLNANYIPFLNPGIQGFDKMVRTFTETKGAKDWMRLAAKCALLGIAPRIINGLLYRDDDDWEEIRDRDKDANYLFKIKDGLWLKIPKGRTLSVLGAGAARIGDAAQGKDVDLGDYAEFFATQTAPANPLQENILRAWFDADLLNKESPGRTWYGTDIEGQRLRNYTPGERYDAKTDVISKWLGKTFDLSPKKINYLLDQYSGVVGDALLPLLTPTAERDMFSAAFTLDSVASNRLSNDFYRTKDELTFAKNSQEATGADAVTLRWFNRQNTAVSDVNKAIRDIEADEGLSDRDKKDMLRVQYGIRNGIEKSALDTLDAYQAAARKYYNASDAAEEGERIDEAYREANREIYGAEYALKTYGKDVYEKSQTLNGDGLGYDAFYDAYFGMKKLGGGTAGYQTITNSGLTDDEQMKALSAFMSEAEYEKLQTGYQNGISPRVYVDFKAELPRFDTDGNGNYTQKEVQAAIDGIAESLDYIQLGGRGPLTQEEKAALWQTANKSWKPKNNPYSVSVGQKVYDAMHAEEPLYLPAP